MNAAEILEAGGETFREKQEDYGDSWKLTGEFLWKLAGDEGIHLETKDDFIAFGLFTRRLDKVARAFNGSFNVDDLNFESLADSIKDEMVYSAMHASLLEEDRLEIPPDYVPAESAHPTVVPANAKTCDEESSDSDA